MQQQGVYFVKCRLSKWRANSEKKKEKRSAGDIKLCQRVDKMLYAASPVPPFYLQSYNGLVISPSPHPVWFPEKGGDKHLALDLHFPPTWIHNYYFSLSLFGAFWFPPRLCLAGRLALFSVCDWHVVFAFYWCRGAEEVGTNVDVSLWYPPPYYSHIRVLPPPIRYFQEPVSDWGTRLNPALSPYIAHFYSTVYKTLQGTAVARVRFSSFCRDYVFGYIFLDHRDCFFVCYSDERIPTAFLFLQRGLGAQHGKDALSE